MKRLWVAAGLVVFAVGICTASYISMNKGVGKLMQILDEGIAAVEREDYFLAADKAADAKKQWKKIYPILMVFLNHHDLADLNEYFILLEDTADNGDIDGMTELCKQSRVYLSTVMETERVTLQNVL